MPPLKATIAVIGGSGFRIPLNPFRVNLQDEPPLEKREIGGFEQPIPAQAGIQFVEAKRNPPPKCHSERSEESQALPCHHRVIVSPGEIRRRSNPSLRQRSSFT